MLSRHDRVRPGRPRGHRRELVELNRLMYRLVVERGVTDVAALRRLMIARYGASYVTEIKRWLMQP